MEIPIGATPVFHVNNNPNYKVLDIYSEYQDNKMMKENPGLYEYLRTRRFTNKSGNDFGYEPHDERHEEYNKRGMSFGQNRSLEEMKISFAVCDKYHQVRDSLFDDYQILSRDSYTYKIQDYEENIFKMRLKMRQSEYLSEPEEEKELRSMSGNEINEKALGIKEFGEQVRKENILTILNHNDFFTKLPTQKFEIFSGESRRELDIEDQIQILISSEDNSEIRADLLEYWHNSKSDPKLDIKDFYESLLECDY